MSKYNHADAFLGGCKLVLQGGTLARAAWILEHGGGPELSDTDSIPANRLDDAIEALAVDHGIEIKPGDGDRFATEGRVH